MAKVKTITEKTTITFIPFEKLVPFALNPREKLDEYSLVPSIRENGLKKPLLVRVMSDGSVIIAQGHRRREAISRIKSGSPECFEDRFGKGVPCIVMPENTTEAQFALAVADHGDSRSLSTDWELYMLCKLLTRAGLKRTEVIKQMASLLDVAKPSRNPEYAKKANELFLIIDDECSSERDSVRAEMEYEELAINQHTGVVQRFQSILAMPEKVEVAFQYTCTGEKREGWEEVALPKIGGDKYKKLYASKDGYLKDVDNGDDNHTLFNDRWNEMLESAKAPKVTAKKSRKRADMVAIANESESKVMKDLMGFAANEPGVNEAHVRQYEEQFLMLDWLKAEKPEVFKELAKEFASYTISVAEVLSESEESN